MTHPARAKSTRGGRVYETEGGDRLPSVTAVTGRLNKPALVPAAANAVARAAYERLAPTKVITYEDIKHLAGAYRDKWSDSARAGSRVHAAIERHLNGEPVRTDCWAVESLEKALSGWIIYGTEVTLCNLKDGWAGTADIIARDGKAGAMAVIDIKSGKGVYDETALQIAAYANATGRINKDGDVEPLDLPAPITVGRVLHIPVNKWAPGKKVRGVWYDVDISDDIYDAFIGLGRAVVPAGSVSRL